MRVATRVAIGLGSNLGDRFENLLLAVRELRRDLRDMSVSKVYETEPLHIADQPRFLNAVVVGTSWLTPHQLLERLQDIERRLGRRRRGLRFGPRIIDLDLLLYDDRTVQTADLQVPHPRLLERGFVLIPLADVVAEWRLPAGSEAAGRRIGDLATHVSSDGIRETDLQLSQSEG